MKKSLVTLFAAGAALLLSAAEPLRLVCTEPADFRGAEMKKQEDGSLLIDRAGGSVRSIKALPVDPSKSYRLSVEYKLAPGCAPIGVIVAVNTLMRGAVLGGMTVAVIPGTMTELAEPIKKGDKSFKVKDVSGWPQGNLVGKRTVTVVFNAKEDLSDLPNRNTCGLIAEVTPDGVVTRRSGAMTCDLPAGTKVRLHNDFESFGIGTLYLRAENDWKTALIIVKPATPGVYTKSTWWPKVNTAGVYLQVRGKSEGDVGVLFRNIVFEQLP